MECWTNVNFPNLIIFSDCPTQQILNNLLPWSVIFQNMYHPSVTCQIFGIFLVFNVIILSQYWSCHYPRIYSPLYWKKALYPQIPSHSNECKMSVRRNTTQIRQLPYIIQTSPSPPAANTSMSFAVATSSSSSSSSSSEKAGSDSNIGSKEPGQDFQQKMQIIGLNVPSSSRRGSNR